jgi:hypothetical protein
MLKRDGALVLCGDARVGERVGRASLRSGLAIQARTDVIARAGQPALFSVWTLGFQAAAFSPSALCLRGPQGETTADAASLREFSGF